MTETIWRINDMDHAISKLGHRVWSVLEVNAGVNPVAWGHQVGIVWTADRWQTNGQLEPG